VIIRNKNPAKQSIVSDYLTDQLSRQFKRG